MCMRRITYLMILLTACVLACSDDDEPGLKEKIDIDDADLVSNSITIENAIKMSGTPPAPSDDPDAPSLYDDSGENFGAVSGRSFYLDPDINQGQATGVYFQIKGSADYYDIPLSAGNTGGRFESSRLTSRLLKSARTAESDVIEIEIPENMEPGIFCALYCVYDEEGRVSNTVEICIEVIEFGGEGSEFFAGQTWEIVSTKDAEGGVVEIQVPGSDYAESYETSVLCDDNIYQTVTVTETYRTNYFYLTFSENGAYEVEAEEFIKEFDRENSNCNSLKYKDKIELYKETGVWTFDETSNILTVVTEYIDDYDGETYTDIFKVELELVNGQLIMSDKEDGENTEITFKKKG